MTCDDFLQDPEACRAHADECESCRKLQQDLDMLKGGLDAPLLEPIVTGELPLAPWEEASHRPWGAILAVGLILLILACVVFLLVGVSPVAGFVDAGKATMSSVMPLRALVLAGSRVREAPLTFQIAVAVGFLLVNVLLYVLLKRPGRGYDAP